MVVSGQTTVGPNNAGIGTNTTGIGSVAWTSPENITTASIVDRAIVTPNQNGISNYLVGTNYGFAIPSNATINGITLVLGELRESGGGNEIYDYSVRLVKNGSVAGSDYSRGNTTNWTRDQGVINNVTYGGANNLWGTTWTASEINSSNFGAAISVTSPDNGVDAYVYYLQISISYTVLTSPHIMTSSGPFTVPPGVTSIKVEAWGGGGGGSTITSNTSTRGGGGGGGAYASSTLTVSPGSTYNVVVGAGGAANTAGGNSSFGANLVLAAGGSGGTINSSTAGAGGLATTSIGTPKYAGGNGANGGSTYSGGGGGGAGTTGAGGIAPTPSAGSFGAGTSLYGGNGGSSVSGSSNGISGSNFGGGGSGASKTTGTNRTGGSGAPGQVIITWTPPPALFVTPGSLDFGNVCTGTSSSEQSFTITGSNLTTSNITVGALSGYAYSTSSGGPYSTSLSLAHAAGSYSQTIFVQFTPAAVTSYNGNIVVGGGGIIGNINVAVSGTGVNTPPSVTSPASSNITANSASLGGNISDLGCSTVTEWGIYYSTTSGFADGAGTKVSTTGTATTGTFSLPVSGLSSNTVYYFKAFATNSAGPVYTSEGSFTTNCAIPGPVTLPWTENFESVGPALTFSNNTTQLNGLCVWDYEKDNNGRLQFNQYSHNGNYAAAFDASPTGTYSINYLIVTLDLGNYNGSTDLELSFWKMNYGEEDNTNDRVWVRGSNIDPWVEIYNLFNGQSGTDGLWNEVTGLDIDAAIYGAGQTVTSTFQIRFGQEDNFSFTNDGRAFDDILISGSLPCNLVLQNLTGGGSYCSGGTGVSVGLDGSETGVTYELYLDGSATGNIVSGTGSAISFGNQTSAGTYTVVGHNVSEDCDLSMAGQVDVTVLSVPGIANNPSPANGSNDICFDGDGEVSSITWDAVADATSYDVYFGAGSLPSTVSANVATPTYSTGPLEASTSYYWKIIPKNSCGDATGESTWTFTTSDARCYCSAGSSAFDLYEAITNVTFAGINNSSPASKTIGYTDYTGSVTPAEVMQGQDYSISVSDEFLVEQGYGGYCKVYIDFNQDGVFDTSTELMFQSPYTNNTTMTGTISIPADAVPGSTRMRIVIEGDANNTGAQPCGSFTWGEVEDYTVNVNAPCTDATLTLTTANSSQSICESEAISVIEYVVSGDATGASVSGLPGGITANYNSGTLTISGTPNVTGTFNYSITTTGTPLGCLEATDIGSISISSIPSVSALTNNGPICSGEDAIFTLAGTDGSTVTYDLNGGTASTVTLFGGTATVTVNGPLANQTINLISISNGSCVQSLTESSTVNFFSPSAKISGSAVICSGDVTNLTISFTGSTPPYSFTYTNGITSTTLSGITSNPYTVAVSPSVSSTYTLSSFSDTNCTGATSGSAAVIVDGGILYRAGNDTTICPEGSATLTLTLEDESVNFDGTSGRINIANDNNINTSVWSNRTVALWFKANDVSTRQILYEEGAQVNGFMIYLEGGYLYVNAWESYLTWGVVRTPVNTDTWYHVAFVYDAAASDGEYFKGYLDGVYFGGNSDPSATDGMSGHSGDINIGMSGGNTRYSDNSTDSNSNYFNGNIDEFKLWNRSLDASELIAERWNVNDGTHSGSNLIVYYNFNNDPASVSTDETGGNNGTISGGVSYQTETPFNPIVSWLPGGMTNLTEIVTPSSNTTYTYTLTHPFSSCQTTSNITVTIDSPVTPSLSGSSPVCPGDDAIFTISGTVGNLVDYTGDAAGTATIGAGGTATIIISNVNANVSLNLVNVNNGNCDLSLTGITATITVEDNTPPVPDNASLPDITSECSVNSLTAPTATDNCSGSVTGTHNASLPITAQGTTVVTWTFNDGNGNTSSQNQNVIINDVTDPTFTCPTAATVVFDASCQITIPDLISGITDESDNCGTPTLSQSPIAGTVLLSGAGTIHQVTITADDGNGNTTSCIVDVSGVSAAPMDIAVVDLGNFCQSGQSGTTTISWNVNLLSGSSDWTYNYTINDGTTDVASGTNVNATGDIIISYVMNNASIDKTYTLTITNVKDDCGVSELTTTNNSDSVTVYAVPATSGIIPD